MQKNILFVVAECQPFISSGGLAEVAGSLPKELMKKDKNIKISVIMPLYKGIIECYQNKLKYVDNVNVAVAWRSQYSGLFKMRHDGVDYYFIDNKYYFDRDNIYGYYDDGERFAFFSRAVLESIPLLGFVPDIIHAHDWHCALVNIYLDVLYKKSAIYMNTKSIFTIHNIEYQGIFGSDFNKEVIGIDSFYYEILEYNGLINLMKAAIVCSDLVTTVSPRYAREITTATYAFGLDYIIRTNTHKLIGIINGINTVAYNPAKDIELSANYTSTNISDKKINKEALQKALNLEVDGSKCLISMIGRLVRPKGIDLVIDQFHEIMRENVQLIILGTGSADYENKIIELAGMYPNRVSALITFNNALSKQIYGGSDLFLMPSKSEPCGLSQMIASRYGTIPIVRGTGGLYDTIKDYTEPDGNGFVFKDYNSYHMLEKIKEAAALYNNESEYIKFAKRIMKINFGWSVSAEKYLEVYKGLL